MKKITPPELIHELHIGERKVQQLTLEGVLARHLVPESGPKIVIRKNISYGRSVGSYHTPLSLRPNEISSAAVAYVVGEVHSQYFESSGEDMHNLDDHTAELPVADYYIPVQFYRHGT